MRNKLPFLLFLSLLPSIRCQSSLETHTFGGSTYKISIVTPASGSVIKFDSLDSFEIAWTGDNKQLAEEHPDLELSICLIPMEGEMDEQFQQDWEAIFSPCQTKIEAETFGKGSYTFSKLTPEGKRISFSDLRIFEGARTKIRWHFILYWGAQADQVLSEGFDEEYITMVSGDFIILYKDEEEPEQSSKENSSIGSATTSDTKSTKPTASTSIKPSATTGFDDILVASTPFSPIPPSHRQQDTAQPGSTQASNIINSPPSGMPKSTKTAIIVGSTVTGAIIIFFTIALCFIKNPKRRGIAEEDVSYSERRDPDYPHILTGSEVYYQKPELDSTAPASSMRVEIMTENDRDSGLHFGTSSSRGRSSYPGSNEAQARTIPSEGPVEVEGSQATDRRRDSTRISINLTFSTEQSPREPAFRAGQHERAFSMDGSLLSRSMSSDPPPA